MNRLNTRMPRIFTSFLASMLAIVPLAAQTTLSEQEAADIATEAYIYGYPLITMEITKQVMTNTVEPQGTMAPMGQFRNMESYPDASFKQVTAPNADTLYSTAWLDLSKEPYVLHVPDEDGRFYLMPMLSAWTEVFADPGTRTTGTKAADYAITGPDWKGTLPDGVKEIKSPTNMVWVLGRTYCSGTPEDYKAVHAIQAQYSLIPLSSFGKSYTPPKGRVNPQIDMNTPVREQVHKLNVPTYFNMLAKLMKENPPAAEDAPIVAKMEKIGIVAGQEFDIKKLSPSVISVLAKAPLMALNKLVEHEKNAGSEVNGWLFSTETGHYGTDYTQRAFVAAIGLGANLPQDAIYPATHVDNEGKPLNGQNRYVIHFDKGQTPPVKGFWSLTMYNDQYFFVANPLNRYTLSPRNQLQYNQDGSLDLYIQSQSPGKDKESNWLPAPAGGFILMFRFYWPEDSIINGSWKIPAVKRV